MKCIEVDCTSFYVDPTSMECVLGSLRESYTKIQQPNTGITVYVKKDINKFGKKIVAMLSRLFKSLQEWKGESVQKGEGIILCIIQI